MFTPKPNITVVETNKTDNSTKFTKTINSTSGPKLIGLKSTWSPWERSWGNEPSISIKAGESDKSVFAKNYTAPVFSGVPQEVWNCTNGTYGINGTNCTSSTRWSNINYTSEPSSFIG